MHLVQCQGFEHAIPVLEEHVADALAHQCDGVADDAHALDVVLAVRQRLVGAVG